ncbi:NAD(P)H-quinone oxidoreductase (plasmid) [Sinorhizobium meliloti WSM1022]|uniref:NAD(P)H-quinone oxidoreductase n=1 Tax=Rhizobium meliloti TaxID=382 RepID=UPI000313D4C1|nr:NAD(P)H-quinone oxidoreductase [Sinorhizobium meliloti]MDE3761931.1 NAD(P)H-quinone oxidoreductase [Sinorhizobium meliloti]MDE3831486.1 NAD(P)H-quinone oxidoreductase [Sinorhizobium meliloti]MDE4579172.1 NAD(P)H-quinone oxidoreductase [Sinorhizobium meliloti]MDW9627692.1 zinc-binding dehydrogenase [Sinorhizobium meliloti]MDW9712006.1 zinc-binding dehydrogenase [Sinorhizobium meliloti]
MSATTRAVIASRPGGPEVLQIVERLRPVPGEGEMLVRVSAAGINRPDVMQRQGNYPPPPGASDILGLELAGVVESLGSGVRRFKPGNRVMALVHSGAYAEWAVVQEASALPVPDGMSLVEAGAFPETYFTVWSNVFERAGLKPGETLLIHGGTSGIGTTALMLAKAIGAKVIVTAGSPEKCEACLKLGADGAIDYRRQDFVAVSKELTGGRGPDVILDMVGGDYIARNLEAVAVDGRIAQIAFQKGSKAEVDFLPLLMKRITLTGSTLRARPLAMKAKLAASLEEHVLPVLARGEARPLIDSTYPFEQVADAHARMDSDSHTGKIVLVMETQA